MRGHGESIQLPTLSSIEAPDIMAYDGMTDDDWGSLTGLRTDGRRTGGIVQV